MIMDTISNNIVKQQQSAYELMKRGKRGAAALIAADCSNIAVATTTLQDDDNTAAVESALTRCKLLDHMLDIVLNPYDAISEWNNLDWLRWLISGGKTLDEFSNAVRNYDYSTCCGLVWTANYVAYRCRTCSISPCMSLCGDCFKRGNHKGHDFNMFRSQAGGACDCGDPCVMKPNGFCLKHSNLGNNSDVSGIVQPPSDLLSVAERIMPRLFLRLVQYLRENSKMVDPRIGNTHVSPDIGINQRPNVFLVELDPFLGMLHDLSGLGAAMRRVMTISLINEKIYQWACDYYYNNTENDVDSNDIQHTIYTIYTDKVRRYYNEAVNQYNDILTNRQNYNYKSTDNSVVNINSEEDIYDDEFELDDFVDARNSVNKLSHSSFLQEIVFWTVRYEFPQKLVCLLLDLLPDSVYKESLTEAFVMHYGCIGRVLATTRDSDTLSNHIVHISVQLFSNEALATRMVNKLGLLRIMVSNLRRMMAKILIPCTLHDITRNKHKIVDCFKPVMKDHCYWPLVSDLNNVLSHRPIAIKFMSDDRLLKSWFCYLSMFQGMNVNCQELEHHVEFEPNTYYAAFSAELEASAYPMWAMLSHLVTPETLPLTTRVVQSCLQRLRKWLIDIGYYNNRKKHTVFVYRTSNDRHKFTFHLPLHRYLAVFLCQAVRVQGANVKNLIQFEEFDTVEKDNFLLAIATHPLRTQSAFYEIMNGSWIRNGLQIKGQAMTYIQSNFCISMVDADIYLTQLCLSELSDPKIFMILILEKFNIYNSMKITKSEGLPQIMNSLEFAASNMESLLMFLTTLVGVRTNLCSDKDYEFCQTQLEIITLLCVSDKTHSQLIELMPERCAVGIQSSSNNINSTSQNHQESSLPTRDFEIVLQAVAEYKKPQFEESGNMLQGLYVPLPHIWKNLYDPIHVLLRAVHRRDFQSSMDRYTTFMRSIGLLKQNQTPWPPYKTPLNQHSAYKDPRRVLLSKLFHTVVWHSLYRTIFHKDVCEHVLSMLIYLLDQAWICYNNTSVTNNNQMTSNPQNKEFISGETYNKNSDITINMCPKRRIKITADSFKTEADEFQGSTVMDSWYENDDLINNLCTVITHIELPQSCSQNYFTFENTANTSIIENNIFDYLTSTNSGSNFETVNSHQQKNANTSLDMDGVERIPIISHSNQNESESTVPSMDSALNSVKHRLCPPPQKLMSLNIEEQQASELSNVYNFDINNQFHSGSQENDQELPCQNSCNIFNAETKVNDKNQQHSWVSINQSIISLLLKLHSHLSGNPDSYRPPPLTPNLFEEVKITTESVNEDDNVENILCGDGSYYVGRFLNKIAKNRFCYECIMSTRYALWPKAVIMRETATRENEECLRQERKRRARDKQQKLLEEITLAQKSFLENFSDLDSTNTQLQSPNLSNNMECDYSPTNNTSIISHIGSDSNASLSNLVINLDSSTKTNKQSSIEIESTVDCVICNQTVFIHVDQQNNDPIGLVILIQGTNILGYQRHLKTLLHANNYKSPSNDQIDGDEKLYWPSLQCVNDTTMLLNKNTTYASHLESHKRIMCQYFNNLNKADSEKGIFTTTAISNTPVMANVHVQTCGHHLHLRCLNSYITSLRGTSRFNSDRGEYSCPLCRQLANSLMPLIPPSVSCDNQKYSIPVYNEKTDMSYAMNKLTDLIMYQESILVKPVSTNDNSMGEFPSTPINNGEYLFDNELNFQHHLHNYENASGLNSRIENIESGENSLLVAINKCVNHMITSIIKTVEKPSILLTSDERDNLYKIRWHSIVSVAWTNIQIELVQRNHNLIEEPWSTLSYYNNYCQHKNPSVTDGNMSSNNYYKMLPKRNCLGPLLKVLRMSAQWLFSKYPTNNQNPLSDIWNKLIGVNESQQKNMIYPPLLLRDPCNLLLQLVLLLPVLDSDMFDTLVKLTYNMQVYISALKVATALNHGSTSVTTTEETHTSINNIHNRIAMEIDNSSLSSMDIPYCTTEILSPGKQTTPFLKTIAFANSVVFSPQDKANDLNMDMIIDDEKCMMQLHDNCDDMVRNQIDISDAVSHENDPSNTSDIFLLEKYGRQCTLPFLRFAALLKKYTNEKASLLLQKENLCVEQQSLSSDQTSHSQHCNKVLSLEEANYSGNDSMKNLLFPHCYCHLLQDDREFLMLARYLNLLNVSDNKKCCNCHIQDSNYYENVEMKQCSATSLQMPSVMDAVTWPKSYSTGVDNIDTGISRKWLMSFRESLTASNRPITIDSNKIPGDDVCTNVISNVEVNHNSTTNILMSARLLLGVDCCDGEVRTNNGDTDIFMTSGRNLLPIFRWIGPRLLKLPYLYDDLFQYYISRPCFRCHNIPRETTVCLICGSIICFKENCCRSSNIYEAVQHSLECGGSTGIFLVVTSSSIVVIRGKRACLWGSVYLDAFGEEDRELKRGKPLYLSAERYGLLERQWLAHRFDHTNKKWVWHRDAL